MSLAQFAETYYEPGSRPSPATLRRWAEKSISAQESGDKPIIPAVRMGKAYFVDLIRWEAQDDPLVLSVLNG